MSANIAPLRRIVTRLRGAFLLAVVLLLTMLAIVAFQSREIETSQRVLTEFSIPKLVQTQNIQNTVEAISLSFRKLQVTRNTLELNAEKDNLNNHLELLEEQILALNEVNQISEIESELLGVLNSVSSEADLFVAQRSEVFTTGQKIEEMKIRVIVLASDSRSLIENILLQKTDQNSLFIEKIQSQSVELNKTQIDQELSGAFLSALNLAELATNFETIAEQINALVQAIDPIEISRTLGVLNYRTTVLVDLIQQLEPSQEQKKLALNIVEIRRNLNSSEGLTALKRNLVERQNQNAEGVDTAFKVLAKISDRAAQLAQESFGNVALASERLETDFRQTTGLVAIAGFVSLCLLGITGFVVVEMQINRRVSALTKSVRAIAGGDLSFPVKQDGQDEVRAIADALQVFRANAEELVRSNEELEKFAYVAAHDLRSPLVAIKDLAEWTIEDPDNALSEDSRENLGLLRTRVERLNRLLSDLLTYSRLGFKDADYSDFDLSEYVVELQDMLSPNGEFKVLYSGPQISHYLPVQPLKQILLNLVSNAIKHHDKMSGEIHVFLSQSEQWYDISVADDGPGIALKYHDRVFELFQTLQSRDTVEGSGLGLAIVAKLVQRLDGEIAVKSDPEIQRGLRVNIRLPLRPSKRLGINSNRSA